MPRRSSVKLPFFTAAAAAAAVSLLDSEWIHCGGTFSLCTLPLAGCVEKQQRHEREIGSTILPLALPSRSRFEPPPNARDCKKASRIIIRKACVFSIA